MNEYTQKFCPVCCRVLGDCDCDWIGRIEELNAENEHIDNLYDELVIQIALYAATGF